MGEWTVFMSTPGFLRVLQGTITLLVALGVYVMAQGGTQTVRDWIAAIGTAERNKARALIRGGMDPHAPNEADDDERLDGFIAGIDQWRRLNNALSDRQRSLRRAVPVGVVLLATSAALWALHPLGGLAGELVGAAWLVLAAYFLYLIGPLVWLALHHGAPRRNRDRLKRTAAPGVSPGVADDAAALADSQRHLLPPADGDVQEVTTPDRDAGA